MNLKLPFGLKDGKLLHVSEVERGLQCNCICPSCSHPLIARKGEKVIHHFAHYKSNSCENAVETSLHLAAKEILESEKMIRLPAVKANIDHISSWIIQQGCDIYFDKVVLESKLDTIVPDVLIYFKEKPLIIEITVTHGIDPTKLNKIKQLGISTLEISLKDKNREINREELKNIILYNPENKYWAYNTKAEWFKQEIYKYAQKMLVIERGLAPHIDNCPIPARVWRGKPYANLTDDCFCCKYLLDALHCETEEEFERYGHSPFAIFCLGKSRISNFQDFMQLRNLQK